MKKFLLATDGSEGSQKAAHQVVEMMKNISEYQLTLINVVDYETSKHDVLTGTDTFSIQVEREKKLLPVTDIFIKEGIHYELRMEKGDPSESVLKAAKELDVDLIVVGSRDLNALQELVLGSVSHKILQKSDRPVLVIK
ncbi:universal stress protein [Rossellomorea aquimaris]|uniref:universal stress protein n=1 Tax=Rossellomorea aquimaris TaxID=189382 RepID=UPI0007D05075|nr:universal stress protein [Rossellomorea aquimaris]